MRRDSYYYWCEGEVVHTAQLGSRSHIQLYCVDIQHAAADGRYGMFNPRWTHVPLQDFPKEFRMQLLLLGVS